ncbi:MAG TPA: IPT/TIG domain-containing protein [Candidatus Ozemobacteraceae bacterium]
MKRLFVILAVLLSLAAIGCGGGGGSNPVSTTTTPQIAGFSPQTGGPGTTVQLWGAYFGAAQGSSIVYYNYEPCTINSWSDTIISCTLPNTARTSGTFIVSVGGKSSAASTQFTLNAPQITSIFPAGGPADTLVTISGVGFGTRTDYSRVSFNGSNAPIESWSNSFITCRVPSGLQNGSVPVIVYISYDYYVTTSFNYVLPAITSLSSVNSSSTGNNVGAEIAINGQGFGSYQSEYNGQISFGGAPVSWTSWTSNRVTFRIPAGTAAGYHSVSITVNGKSVSSGWNVYEPNLSNPNLSTVYDQGDLVTLSGNYLGLYTDQAQRSVKFGDATVTSFVSWTDTGISFYNPIEPTLLSNPTISASVVVGGLQSNAVNVKVN